MSKNKKIHFLYVCSYFAPVLDPCSIRTLEVSRRLIEYDIFPTILTRKASGNDRMDFNLLKLIPTQLKVHRIPKIAISNKLLKYYLNWIPKAYLKGLILKKKYGKLDFIYATGPLFNTFILAYLLKITLNIPLVLEYRDPWGHNPYKRNKAPSILDKLNLLIEKLVLKQADIIITVSPALITFFHENFPFTRKKPLVSIESGLQLKDHQKLQNQEGLISFTFTGSLYGERSIIPFFKILSKLKEDCYFKNKKFKLNIYGKYREDKLNESIKKLQITDLVNLGGFVSKKKADEAIRNSTFALHIGENMDYPTLSMKVWDYLSENKKIIYLGLENSYTSKFLTDNNLGIILPINDLEKSQVRFRSLIDSIEEKSYTFGIDDTLLSQFTWDKKVDKLNKIFKTLLK